MTSSKLVINAFILLLLGSNILSQSLSGQVNSRWEVEHLLTIQWNDTTGVPYSQVPGANLGVISFVVLDDQVAMLCNGQSEVRMFSLIDGQIMNKFHVDFAARDIVYNGNHMFVLTDRQIFVHSVSGIRVGEIEIPAEIHGVMKLHVIENDVYLLLPTGNTLKLQADGVNSREEKNGWILSSEDYVYTTVAQGTANTHWFRDGVESVRAINMNHKVAAVFPVGIVGNRVVLDVQSFLSENPVEVIRHYVSIDYDEGDEEALNFMIKAPDSYYVYMERDIYMRDDGNIYNMVSSPTGVHLFKLSECMSNICEDYPIELRELKYHFNYHLINVE